MSNVVDFFIYKETGLQVDPEEYAFAFEALILNHPSGWVVKILETARFIAKNGG
jgi:hypothetical protein